MKHRHLVARALALVVFIPSMFIASDAAGASAGNVLWCAFQRPKEGETQLQAITRLEAKVGRKYRLRRIYYYWNTPFPYTEEAADAKAGRIPFISWKPIIENPTTGVRTPVRWDAIAAGKQDTLIKAKAVAAKNYVKPIFITFHHEPENESPDRFGTSVDYVKAFRRIVTLFRSIGATNVKWLTTTMIMSFRNGDQNNWWPGDSYMDFVGVDGYNWYPKPGAKWRSFREIFEPAYRWAKARGEPIVIPEVGVQEDPAVPGRKAQWLKDSLATMKSWPLIKGFCYFNSDNRYDWRVESSASSLAAYKEMAQDPWMKA